MRPVGRPARGAGVVDLDELDSQFVERGTHGGDHVQGRRAVAGRGAHRRAKTLGDDVEIGAGKFVALGVDARAEGGTDRPAAVLAHGRDGRGQHTLVQASPTGVGHAHRSAGVVDEDHRRAVGGHHGDGRVSHDGDGSISRRAGVLSGRIHHDHVSAVDLPEPGPGEVGDDVTANFRIQGRPEVAVRSVGEADLGSAEPQRPQPVT